MVQPARRLSEDAVGLKRRVRDNVAPRGDGSHLLGVGWLARRRRGGDLPEVLLETGGGQHAENSGFLAAWVRRRVDLPRQHRGERAADELEVLVADSQRVRA